MNYTHPDIIRAEKTGENYRQPEQKKEPPRNPFEYEERFEDID